MEREIISSEVTKKLKFVSKYRRGGIHSDYKIDMWEELQKRSLALAMLAAIVLAVLSPRIGAPGGPLHTQHLSYIPRSYIYYAAGRRTSTSCISLAHVAQQGRLLALSLAHAHVVCPMIAVAIVTAFSSAIDYTVVKGILVSGLGAPAAWLSLSLTGRPRPALVAAHYVAGVIAHAAHEWALCKKSQFPPLLEILTTIATSLPPFFYGLHRTHRDTLYNTRDKQDQTVCLLQNTQHCYSSLSVTTDTGTIENVCPKNLNKSATLKHDTILENGNEFKNKTGLTLNNQSGGYALNTSQSNDYVGIAQQSDNNNVLANNKRQSDNNNLFTENGDVHVDITNQSGLHPDNMLLTDTYSLNDRTNESLLSKMRQNDSINTHQSSSYSSIPNHFASSSTTANTYPSITQNDTENSRESDKYSLRNSENCSNPSIPHENATYFQKSPLNSSHCTIPCDDVRPQNSSYPSISHVNSTNFQKHPQNSTYPLISQENATYFQENLPNSSSCSILYDTGFQKHSQSYPLISQENATNFQRHQHSHSIPREDVHASPDGVWWSRLCGVVLVYCECCAAMRAAEGVAPAGYVLTVAALESWFAVSCLLWCWLYAGVRPAELALLAAHKGLPAWCGGGAWSLLPRVVLAAVQPLLLAILHA